MSQEAEVCARRYTDLRLELRDLDPDSDRYVASLSGPTIGELPPVAVRLAHDEIGDELLDLEDGALDSAADLIPIGRALADRLLPAGAVRTAVTGAIRAAGPDDGVRLRLVVRDPRLAQLPWEYTYLSMLERESMSDFLVLDPKVSLVRHEAMALPARALTGRDPGRLRILAVTANVSNLPRLDLRTERRVVEQAVKAIPADGASIDLRPVLENPSPAALRDAIVTGADIFHYAGHAAFHGEGYLALPADGGDGVGRLAADQLARMLRQAGVRVAVLGACESGRRDGVSPWEGIAAALLSAEVAAVVAMQYRIRDSDAIKFARGLYTALAVGLTIDEAVTAGRLALFDAGDYRVPWGTPVLYSRASDGVLFAEATERDSASANALRATVRQVATTVANGGSLTGIRIGDVRDAAGMTISVTQNIETASGDVVGVEIGRPHMSRTRDGAATPAREPRDSS